ncbi:MAG: hypothetical protein H6R07_449 [Proteobacteria bacterium]|nr:hypothetical protein [Pseudomonadota bacterium]
MKTLILALIAGLAVPVSAMEPDKFFEKTAPSVWLVRIFDADGLPAGKGSAVTIAPGKLLTNCHVLAKAKRFEIGQGKKFYPGKLELLDFERDMCQISAENFPAPAVPLGNSDGLRVGQKVFALGNPRGLELTLSNGLISALRSDNQDQLKEIQISAPISQGSSGGGLFDEQGRLIGITTRGYIDGQNLNFAIPINWVKDLSERSRAVIEKMNKPAQKVTEAEIEAGQSMHPYIIPPPSGFARIEEGALVPIRGELRQSYTNYLEKPAPKAFVIGDKSGAFTEFGPDSIRQAFERCFRTNWSCWLYAVDDRVLWTTRISNRLALRDLKPLATPDK